MCPLSDERANRLVTELAAQTPATVIDLGCGWGELLLRILAATPGACGIGVDNHAPDVVRGRTNAAARGLSDRVAFIEGPAADHLSAADIVISLGAYQAHGSIPEALGVLRKLVNPGGCLLFGVEFWEQPRRPRNSRRCGRVSPLTIAPTWAHLSTKPSRQAFALCESKPPPEVSGRNLNRGWQPTWRSGCCPIPTMPQPTPCGESSTRNVTSGCAATAM
jgi:ubiquinone/menaquinone biosynthesis C-methylase UbiE